MHISNRMTYFLSRHISAFFILAKNICKLGCGVTLLVVPHAVTMDIKVLEILLVILRRTTTQ